MLRMTHIQAEDIRTGSNHLPQLFRRLGRGPESANDPRFSHGDHA
jgi:hypothetical protein